ncbi:transposase, partial [Limnoraphis robusta Tam1]
VKNHHLAKSISDASWYQFTQWLDYFGKIWDKAVVSVSPHFTSQDCSNCDFRVKKSLSTRTHRCPKCKTEICRDTNAALNILKKGMSILGAEFNQYSTEGHSESASLEGKLGETSISVDEEKSDSISRVDEPRISNS